MYTWSVDVPEKRKKYFNYEYILNDSGVFMKCEHRNGDNSLTTALWYVGTNMRVRFGKPYLAAPHGRCAILWRKVSGVETDGKKITVFGNAESEIELFPPPELYGEILSFIEEMRKSHPMKRSADREAACWFCFGLDEDWDIGPSLQEMIDEELRYAQKREIDEDSLEATVISD